MENFYITKAIDADKLVAFVDILNTMTRDGYVADQTQITQKLWLLRIACTHRDDVALIRGM